LHAHHVRSRRRIRDREPETDRLDTAIRLSQLTDNDLDQIGDKGIAALARGLDEHGWQIVPREPTEAMMKAGRDTGIESDTGIERSTSEAYLEEAYAAMLAAAPSLSDGWPSRSGVSRADGLP
jgi:hypothetical protein